MCKFYGTEAIFSGRELFGTIQYSIFSGMLDLEMESFDYIKAEELGLITMEKGNEILYIEEYHVTVTDEYTKYLKNNI